MDPELIEILEAEIAEYQEAHEGALPPQVHLTEAQMEVWRDSFSPPTPVTYLVYRGIRIVRK